MRRLGTWHRCAASLMSSSPLGSPCGNRGGVLWVRKLVKLVKTTQWIRHRTCSMSTNFRVKRPNADPYFFSFPAASFIMWTPRADGLLEALPASSPPVCCFSVRSTTSASTGGSGGGARFTLICGAPAKDCSFGALMGPNAHLLSLLVGWPGSLCSAYSSALESLELVLAPILLAVAGRDGSSPLSFWRELFLVFWRQFLRRRNVREM